MTNPSWTLISSLKPAATGVQSIKAQVTLGAGSLQAVRVSKWNCCLEVSRSFDIIRGRVLNLGYVFLLLLIFRLSIQWKRQFLLGRII